MKCCSLAACTRFFFLNTRNYTKETRFMDYHSAPHGLKIVFRSIQEEIRDRSVLQELVCGVGEEI